MPLELALTEVSGATASRQRLLASGRLPPDSYAGLALQIGRATLAGEGKPADLLVPKEPVRIDLPLQLARGRAAVASVALRAGQVQESDFDFAGHLTGHVLEPASTVLERAGYVSRPGLASLAVIDRRAHEVTAVVPTGREPTGLAVDALARRAYVALGGEDQVQILDLASGEELGRIPLRSGDEPADLALTPDGRIVLVVAKGSNTHRDPGRRGGAGAGATADRRRAMGTAPRPRRPARLRPRPGDPGTSRWWTSRGARWCGR